MNPTELLENTQSSVCPPELGLALAQLKELRSEQLSAGKSLKESMAKLKENQVRNEA